MRADELAAKLLELHFGPDWSLDWPTDPCYTGPCNLIDVDKVDKLTDALMEFVAEVVVGIIDAGSERDAVLENEALRKEIRKELYGWSRGKVTPEQMAKGMVMDWSHDMVVPGTSDAH